METKYQQIIIGIIVVIVLIGMINPFKMEWDKGWNIEKEEICLPYTTNGIVFVYEGNSHCSEKQNSEKQKFTEYYCSLYSCNPVLKSEKTIREIYEEWNK